ncbi:hypothetical protein [Paracoccus sediminilitoris]|uniref:hypothetical protein n=1 Tax=Paracoccus sediminilitoris TaxID=2202419 RepID=UPI000DBAA3F9|nr:hypothetical protein [Paracoccus sediminilitoris]
MSDISASERRLSAALDRLDQLLDTQPAAVPAAAPGEDPAQIAALTRQLEQLQAENDQLRQAASVEAPAVPQDQDQDQDDLRRQLDEATQLNAEMAVANDQLAEANRNLIEAQETGGIGADEIRDALEAEVKALRAARQAEIAQMGEIMAELERLLGDAQSDDRQNPEPAPTQEGI